MQKLSFPSVHVVAAAALTGCLLSSPVSAERAFYRWTTDDGTYAFTDDRENIPERYQDRAEVGTLKPLRDYERFTVVETPEVAPAGPPPVSQDPVIATPFAYPVRSESMAPTISVRTGDENAPIIDVSPGTSHEPIVIEKRHFKPDGAISTRSNTIVRQGDRILTVIKPQAHEHDVTDFGDESDFER
jgi:hypothetical protein